MKKLLIAFAVLAVAGIYTSCNSAANGDPKTVLMAFFDAMSKNDISGAKKLATASSQPVLDMAAMKMMGDSKSGEYDKSKMTFGETKINGDMATVPVTMKNETINFNLQKESGKWKVAFDKGNIFKIGIDKANEKGIDINKMMQEGFDKMKDINTDSLKDAMHKGFEALDTLKDQLKKMQDN